MVAEVDVIGAGGVRVGVLAGWAGRWRPRRPAAVPEPGTCDDNVGPTLSLGQQRRPGIAVSPAPGTATPARRCCSRDPGRRHADGLKIYGHYSGATLRPGNNPPS